jgi:outer membrane protein assembly factor BamD
VQEVLAEREFRIGRFYYLRESWAASIARLQSLIDAYPLYSGADEALYLLGDAYGRQADLVRSAKIPEPNKQALLKQIEQKEAEAFSRIITRYPATDRAGDARKRLEAMHRPVPTPSADALALSKQEEESRQHLGMFGQAMNNFHKHPNVSQTARVGEPTLSDPRPVSAPELVKEQINALTGKGAGGGKLSVETVGADGAAPQPNQPAPRSEKNAKPADTGIADLTPMTSSSSTAPSGDPNAPAATSNSADPNAAPAAPPAQVNEAAQPSEHQADAGSSSTTANQSDGKTQSSSKL